MSNNTLQRLTTLRDKLDSEKEKKYRLEAKADQIKTELKDTYKCNTLGQAKRKLEKLKKEQVDIETSVETELDQLDKIMIEGDG